MKFRTQHFLTGVELDHQELEDVLDLADQLKVERASGTARDSLKQKQVALLFEKPSLRTRVSFSVAVQELGGNVIELVSSNRKKEEPEDTIRVLEGYVHATMVRTFEHGVLDRMAQFSKGSLINGLSDSHHPCQALADLLTLKQEFKKLKGVKLTYLGDGNNVLHSLLLLAPFLGVDVCYSCPKGYEPNSFIVKQAKVRAKEGGGSITASVNPMTAVKGANAIYTDVWTSMGFEDEGGDRDQIFSDYQINEELHKAASPDAILLHCMPMVRGKEITDQMVEHSRSRLFQQSENRLHAQKALLVGLLGQA